MPTTTMDRALMITLSLLLFAVLAMGCLLFPMSDPEKSVMDADLIGTWTSDEEAFAFMPHDKRSYTMYTLKKTNGKWVPDVGDDMGNIYKVFITNVGGTRYLNLQFLSPKFAYNSTLMTDRDLDKIAETAATGGEKSDKLPAEIKKRRQATLKTQIKAQGIAPLFLVAKFSINKDELTLQMLKTPGEKDKEYNELKSIDEVREYIIKKGKFEEAKVYTFKNWARE